MPKRRLPSLNALRAFESAARNQSMTRAAEELCVTHSAISRHVAKLEDYLNAKLFERGHQQVVLTKRGAAYASRNPGVMRLFEIFLISLMALLTSSVLRSSSSCRISSSVIAVLI